MKTPTRSGARPSTKANDPKEQGKKKKPIRLKIFRGAIEGPVAFRASAGAAPPPPTDEVVFEIRWNGGGTAALVDLIDDERAVSGGPWTGSSPITVTYPPPAKALHPIKWRLEFAGRTLTNLRAAGALNEGDAMELGTSDSEEEFWAKKGALL